MELMMAWVKEFSCLTSPGGTEEEPLLISSGEVLLLQNAHCKILYIAVLVEQELEGNEDCYYG